MQDLTHHILELIRLTATDLPMDVENALRQAADKEEAGSAAQSVLLTIFDNIALARRCSTPICQDTGTPIFHVQHPFGWSQLIIRQQIINAVIEATRLNYLRPNSVKSITGENTANNTGDEYYPNIQFQEIESSILTISLLLKGGGCENVSAQYRLPENRLGAGRDLEGVRKVILDAVHQAQGKGCAPGVLGIAIGGDRNTSYQASKEALLRKLEDMNPNPDLAALEERITREANLLGIGPMGFGGQTTVLGTKITALHRIPASYFVSISYMCWACRRRKMNLHDGKISFE